VYIDIAETNTGKGEKTMTREQKIEDYETECNRGHAEQEDQGGVVLVAWTRQNGFFTIPPDMLQPGDRVFGLFKVDESWTYTIEQLIQEGVI
jgi:hypothetical protein